MIVCVIFLIKFSWCAEISVATKDALNEALKFCLPGDRIIMEDGEWRDVTIDIYRSGVKGKPIILEARNPGKVVLTQSSELIFRGSYIEVSGLLFKGKSTRKVSGGTISEAISFAASSSYCRLRQCAIDSYNRTDVKDNWVNIKGTFHQIDHCSFTGKVGTGKTLTIARQANGQADNHVIEYNYFGPRPFVNQNGAETIQIGVAETQFSVSNTRISNNLFESINGEAEIISVKSGGNLMDNNTILNSGGSFTLRHGNGSTVKNNWFLCGFAERSGGIRVYGENHIIVNNYIQETGGPASSHFGISLLSGDLSDPRKVPKDGVAAGNVKIEWNTLINCPRSFAFGSSKSVNPHNIYFANNSVYSGKNTLIDVQDNYDNFKFINNRFYGNRLGIPTRAGIDESILKLTDTIINSYSLHNIEPKSTTSDVMGVNPYSGERRTPLSKSEVGPFWLGGPNTSLAVLRSPTHKKRHPNASIVTSYKHSFPVWQGEYKNQEYGLLGRVIGGKSAGTRAWEFYGYEYDE